MVDYDWCADPAITNVDALLTLAKADRNAAVMVAANRHIAGEDLHEVAKRANWSAANVTVANRAGSLLAGRPCTDQEVLVRAAAAKSPPAAAALLSEGSPELLARLLSPNGEASRGLQDTTNRAGAEISKYWRKAAVAQPGLEQLLAETIEGRIAGHGYASANMLFAMRLACAAGDPDALRDLAPSLLDFRRYDNLCTTGVMIAATAGHPDVVEHWGRHGGETGANLYRLDPRRTRDRDHTRPLADVAADGSYGIAAERVTGLFKQALLNQDTTDLSHAALLAQTLMSRADCSVGPEVRPANPLDAPEVYQLVEIVEACLDARNQRHPRLLEQIAAALAAGIAGPLGRRLLTIAAAAPSARTGAPWALERADPSRFGSTPDLPGVETPWSASAHSHSTERSRKHQAALAAALLERQPTLALDRIHTAMSSVSRKAGSQPHTGEQWLEKLAAELGVPTTSRRETVSWDDPSPRDAMADLLGTAF